MTFRVSCIHLLLLLEYGWKLPSSTSSTQGLFSPKHLCLVFSVSFPNSSSGASGSLAFTAVQAQGIGGILIIFMSHYGPQQSPLNLTESLILAEIRFASNSRMKTFALSTVKSELVRLKRASVRKTREQVCVCIYKHRGLHVILAVLASPCCAGLASLLLSLGLARPQEYFDGFCSSIKKMSTFEDRKKRARQ